MCRSDVAPAAAVPLAVLLTAMVTALAEEAGVDPASIRIGPVDLGSAVDSSTALVYSGLQEIGKGIRK